MEGVWADLLKLTEQWAQLDTALRDAAMHTVHMAYKLESSKIPTLSLQQSKQHVDQLQVRTVFTWWVTKPYHLNVQCYEAVSCPQELQMEVENSEVTWKNLASLFSDLKDKIHPGAAVLLSNELDQGKARSVT